MNAHESSERLSDSHSIKVMTADDDETTRTLLRAALTQWGYQVVEAEDGEEAWKQLQEPNPPHILILDWIMPKLDGIGLCKRIEKELPHRPYIIFLTRLGGTENVIQGLEAGADEFIIKPIDLAELRIRISAGERIIKYRNQLEDQNKELQKLIAHAKDPHDDFAWHRISMNDLVELLEKTSSKIGQVSKHFSMLPEQNITVLQEITLLQNQLSQVITKIKTEIDSLRVKSQQNKSVPEPVAPKSLIDMKRMRDFFGDDINAIRDFFKTFLALTKKQLKEIDLAIQTQNMKAGKYYFHLMGSASGNSGMVEIYQICGIGEEKVSQNNWDEAAKCYHLLIEIVQRLEKEVLAI